MAQMADERGLDKCAANYAALTPLSHLNRARAVYADDKALVYGAKTWSYREFHGRVSRLASALRGMGVAPGDVVSVLAPNIPAMVEATFGVPAMGAVLNTINTRLDADTIAYIFEHSEAKVALVDAELIGAAEAAIGIMDGDGPRIVEIADTGAGFAASGRYPEYEAVLAGGDAEAPWHMPDDEWDAISLNYTSGTTGRPKGVVYHHRGAYLMTMGTVVSWEVTRRPRFLATVPLFHCNGWCHTWMMPLLGGAIICCRNVSAQAVYDAVADHGVNFFGGAPIVLNMLIEADAQIRREFGHKVSAMTAGAPPPPATIKGVEALGFEVMQVYGLTETYGHILEALPQPEWADMEESARFTMMARQGVCVPAQEGVDVVDQQTRLPVPPDGTTLGEIVIHGNLVMKGYYKNPEATAEAFDGGAFRSGDIAFKDPQGYIQVADRLKDIIISGGENVSSVEVEAVLMEHRDVSLCSVVARPDPKWGETPCAFVELRAGAQVSEAELIAHCRSKLAGFKCPKAVVFTELPKTATGKIQKYELRERAKAL